MQTRTSHLVSPPTPHLHPENDPVPPVVLSAFRNGRTMVERGLDRRMPLRLLQAMLAQATDAIVLLSPKNRILAAAGATQEIFGVASEGLIGRSFSRFVAPAARREQRVRLSRMLTLPIEDSRLTVELPVLKNDGCILMCDASSATLVEDGERTGRLVLLRDATARRAVEAALRASEARLQRESERLLALHEASTLLAVQTAGASEIFEQVLRSAVNLLGGAAARCTAGIPSPSFCGVSTTGRFRKATSHQTFGRVRGWPGKRTSSVSRSSSMTTRTGKRACERAWSGA